MTVPTYPVENTAPSPAPAAARAHLLHDGSVEQYRRAIADGVDRVARRVATVDRPVTGITPAELAPLVDRVDLDRPLGDAGAALDELEDVYLRDAVWFHHPRYLAHLNCPVAIPALLGEAVLTAVNSSLDTWDQSAGGTLIERRLIDWTAERIGLGPGRRRRLHQRRHASPTSRRCCWPARRRAPTRDGPAARAELLPRLRILTSAAGHFSVQKSAKLLGLGPDAVIAVPTDARPTDADRRARPRAASAAARGRAGRDGRRRHRRHHRLRLHRPAAGARRDLRGGTASGCTSTPRTAAGCSSRRRAGTCSTASSGPTRSPSTSTSRSSSRSAPARCWSATGATLRHATYHADYLNPARMVEQRIPNQVDKSLQTTRRFDALKLWLTLRVMGAGRASARSSTRWSTWPPTPGSCSAADPRFEVVDPLRAEHRGLPLPARRPRPGPGRRAPTCTPARPWRPPASPWSPAPRSTAATS